MMVMFNAVITAEFRPRCCGCAQGSDHHRCIDPFVRREADL